MKVTLDTLSFELAKPGFSFDFLRNYGKVFRVFDRNDSGNISFGVEDDGKRLFIKVAGAETINQQPRRKQRGMLFSKGIVFRV